MTGLQWIASEAWTTGSDLHTPDFMPYLRGTLGIAMRRGEIPGLKDFMSKTHPGNSPDNRHENNLVSPLFYLVFKIQFQNIHKVKWGNRPPFRIMSILRPIKIHFDINSVCTC